MSTTSSSSSSLSGGLPLQKSTSYSSRRQWSMETAIADHRDLQAGAMGLSRTDGGQFALLGGRRCLALVNLAQDPHTVIKRSVRGFKWDITSIRWSPHHDYIAAVSVNDRVELVHTEQDLTVQYTLKGHSRLVTDVDWNDSDPNVLVTASHDNYLHVWDVRTAPNRQKPLLSFNAMSSTGQARWNRQNCHVLASSHDGDIKLWDSRKPSLPTLYVSAHLARIFSLDWSRVLHDRLVTSGQDCFVKFHDISTHTAKPDRSLKTAVPVWKARYTPFGDGLATVIVPQVHRNDHSLFLWNYHHLDFPVHSFVGHRDVILNFDWRNVPDTNKEMQLVTWSKDHTLRLWQIDPTIQTQCGHEAVSSEEASMSGGNEECPLDSPTMEMLKAEMVRSQEKPSNLLLTTVNDPDLVKNHPHLHHRGPLSERHHSEEQSDRESTPSRTLTSNSLQQEFELLNLSLGSVKMEDVSSGKRTCKFTATVAANQVLHRVSLVVNFPLEYPTNVPPTFTFGKGTTLDANARGEILKTLNHTANEKVRRNRTCLEPCLRQLENMLEQIPLVSDKGPESPSYPMSVSSGKPSLGPITSTDGLMATFDNANVPYPRSSGARFSANGLILVCFGRSTHVRPLQQNDSNKVIPTPRALSAYDARRQMMHQMETYQMDGYQLDNTYHGGQQQQQQRILNSPSSINYSVSSNISTASHSNLNGVKSYEPPQDMTKKGRFKVRKVKSTSEEPSKNVLKESNKIKTGGNISLSPKQQQQQLKQQQLGAMGTGKITIYNVSKLFPYSVQLGNQYVLLDNPEDTCSENSLLAAQAGRPDLERTWRVCARIAAALNHNKLGPDPLHQHIAWTHHPLGRPMLTSLIDHYIRMLDFQTAAMIACTFHHQKVEDVHTGEEPWSKPKHNRTLESPPFLPPQHHQHLSSHLFEPMATMMEDKENSSTQSTPKAKQHVQQQQQLQQQQHQQQQASKKFWFLKPGAISGTLIDQGLPYHTVTATVGSSRRQKRSGPGGRALPFNVSETNLETFQILQKSQRSNSWSDSFINVAESSRNPSPTMYYVDSFAMSTTPNVVGRQMSPLKRHFEELVIETREKEESRILDPKFQPLYESLKEAYANLLYNWQCFQQRCEVVKRSQQPPALRLGLGGEVEVEVTISCPCQDDSAKLKQEQPHSFSSNSGKCNTCQRQGTACMLCGLPVRGLATVCFVCGHGGHLQHLQEWFELPQSGQLCAAPGCLCPCLQYLTD